MDRAELPCCRRGSTQRRLEITALLLPNSGMALLHSSGGVVETKSAGWRACCEKHDSTPPSIFPELSSTVIPSLAESIAVVLTIRNHSLTSIMHAPCHFEAAAAGVVDELRTRGGRSNPNTRKINHVWTMRRSAHLGLIMICGMILSTLPSTVSFSPKAYCSSRQQQHVPALASSFAGESSTSTSSSNQRNSNNNNKSKSPRASVDAAVSKAVSSLEHAAASATASTSQLHKTSSQKLVHAKRQAQREYTNLESAFFITVQDSSPTTAETSKDTKSKQRAWSRRVAELTFQDTTDPVLLFDGVCNLCNDAVIFCLDHDSRAVLRFASLQSKVGQALMIENGRDPEDRSTMVLVTATSTETHQSSSSKASSKLHIECLTGSDAVLKLAGDCLGDLPVAVRVGAQASRVLVPRWFRDAVLKLVSENRHVLGETDGPTCRLDLDGIYEKRFLEDPDLE